MGKLFTLIIAMGILCSSQNELFAKTIEKNLEDEKVITIGSNQCKIYAKVKYDIEIASEDIPENKDESEKTDEETKQLADVVEIGDYVNYDANSGLASPVTYTTDVSLTGDTTSTTFSSKDSMKWRVLSVDRESGKVELMSADSTSKSLLLRGEIGYINAEDVLNDIGAVYGHGKGATEGRSINVDDVEQYSSYDKSTYANGSYKYGETRKHTSGDYFIDIGDGAIEGGVANTDKGYTECLKATSANPVIAKQTYYRYTAKDYFENETIYKMLFKDAADTRYKDGFWLASRCVDIDYDNFALTRLHNEVL